VSVAGGFRLMHQSVSGRSSEDAVTEFFSFHLMPWTSWELTERVGFDRAGYT